MRLEEEADQSYNDAEAQPKISDLVMGQQEVKALRPREGCDAVRLGFGKNHSKHLPLLQRAAKGLL